MTYDTQYQAVLAHMRKRGSITSLIAFQRHRITRLARVIFELKERGHLINSATIKRSGKVYAAYSLVE